MPFYTFTHPDTGECVDLFFHMNDEKQHIDSDGIKWERQWHTPELNATGSSDAWDSKKFVEKTGRGRAKIGDMLDMSSDLSRERASSNGGVDPLKENYYKRYSKERNGAIHPDKNPKTFENKHVKIDL